MDERCFKNNYNRMLVTCEYPLSLMAVFHTHRVERSRLLRSRLVLWFVDKCYTYATSWQKPVELSKSVTRFRQTQIIHSLSLIQALTTQSWSNTLNLEGENLNLNIPALLLKEIRRLCMSSSIIIRSVYSRSTVEFCGRISTHKVGRWER